MPDHCIVCGDPVYLHVDERPFCQHHAEVVLRELERLIDHLKANQWPAIVTRFATVEDFLSEKLRASIRHGEE